MTTPEKPDTLSQSQPSAADTPDGKKSTTKEIRLTILPDTFSNSLFTDNLAYFKTAQAGIYNAIKDYTCQKYRLCTTVDGELNILDLAQQQTLYQLFSRQEIVAAIQKKITRLPVTALIADAILQGGEQRWRDMNPIQRGMLDALYEAGPLKRLGIKDNNLTPIQAFTPDYIPLLRIYGIGLGYHITELLSAKSISFLILYEPEVDLFYTSLFTTPWKILFDYFEKKGKALSLIIGSSPEEAVKKQVLFLRQHLLPLTTFYHQYVHFNTAVVQKTMALGKQVEATERSQTDGGWYEDQRSGFFRSARNIRAHHKFYNGKKAGNFQRAFIVGSGPSLNDTIDLLRDHQDKAAIISCGSAIGPLLAAGIIPDYEVVQERTWHLEHHEEKLPAETLKKIKLLKLNVCTTLLDHHYKEVFIFQKFRDPGSALLGPEYKVTTAVNPTVTNAGISICADLGVQEAYLFGVDYGAPESSERMHAANTIYDARTNDTVGERTHGTLPGNFGKTVRTNNVLAWSHDTTEKKIAEFPQIRWFNIGEGALIKGAQPLQKAAFPKTFPKTTAKEKMRAAIDACFDNNYDTKAVFTGLQTTLVDQVDEYFNAMIGFKDAAPQNREEIVYVLTLMYQAVNTGKDVQGYLPATLLPYGFNQFITDVFLQTGLAEDDASALVFYEQAFAVLQRYIEEIKDDFSIILSMIEEEEEPAVIRTK